MRRSAALLLAVALAACGHDAGPNALTPADPTLSPATESATPSPTASPTPSPTPTPAHPPSHTPSPTPVRTTTAPPLNVAHVVLDNGASEAARVYVGKESYVVPAHHRTTVDTVPRADHNDYVSVASVAHPSCGRSDPGLYFQVGHTYRVVIRDTAGCTDDAGRAVTYPGFEVY
jgi:hypothetical protein